MNIHEVLQEAMEVTSNRPLHNLLDEWHRRLPDDATQDQALDVLAELTTRRDGQDMQRLMVIGMIGTKGIAELVAAALQREGYDVPFTRLGDLCSEVCCPGITQALIKWCRTQNDAHDEHDHWLDYAVAFELRSQEWTQTTELYDEVDWLPEPFQGEVFAFLDGYLNAMRGIQGTLQVPA